MSVQAAIEDWKETILGQAGITGLARGAGSEKIIIYVEKLSPQILTAIPKELSGFPVEVKSTGKLQILQARTGRWRPIIGGISLGHPLITAGTLTERVLRNDTKELALHSCNHVLALNWGEYHVGHIGDSALQPGPFDGGTDPNDKVGELDRWINVELLPAENLIDSAIASIMLPEGCDAGAIDIEDASYSIDPQVGMRCYKSGRTTGTTWSTVESIGAVIDVEGWGVCRFKDQIIFRPALGAGGDSGSLTAEGVTERVVGSLFAGSSEVTAVNAAKNIENLQGIKFIGPPVSPPPSVGRPSPLITLPYLGPLSTALLLTALCA